MDNSVNNEINRGQMDTMILLSLVDGDKHTNEIRDEIERRTAGHFVVKQGTFYSCLDRIKKQGLLREYRSSTSDGIRRKFYSLNQKGKNYIEKHFGELPYLITHPDAEETAASDVTTVNMVEPAPIVEQKAEEKIITAPVQEPVNNENKKVIQNSEPDEDEFTAFINSAKQENDFSFFKVDDFSQSDKYFDSINREIYDEMQNETEKFSENSFDDEIFSGFYTENDGETEEEQYLDERSEKEKQDTINAIYDSSDSGPTEYKSILKKLFPEKTQTTAKQEATPAVDAVPEKPAQKEEKPVEYEQEIEEKSNERKRIFSKAEKKNKVVTYKYDFSDLYKMAEEEGFRLKVSSATNRAEIGKILINKLRFHTTLIHFLLACIQIAVIALSVGKLLNLKPAVYLILIGVLALAPIVSGIIYKVYPNARIKEIYLFKNAIELALMITLNMILIICAFAVLMSIDFNNGIQLLKYIILPILVVINIPVYVFIKYSLLDKNIYLSK